jgi:DNA-binding beta-propeller fold protein YncE
MWRRLILTAASCAAILVLGAGVPARVGSASALYTTEITPLELNAIEHENGCLDSAADTDAELKPARTVKDAYPNFLGVAVDPVNSRVVMSDSGLKGLIMYDRAAGTSPGTDQVTKPLADLRGSKTEIGFVAGVALDRRRKEKYTVNNDGGDKVVVFDYDREGNVAPERELRVTHQAWGIALDQARNEMAVTVEINNWIEFYPRTATGTQKPTRFIKGDKTGLADPHGIVIDADNDEILVANHGNWTSLTSFDTSGDPGEKKSAASSTSITTGGQFRLPSIRVFPANAKGDTAPTRVIEGAKTGLNWPMSLDVDTKNNEIVVANSGDNRVLIFRRSDKGNVEPLRAIGGSNTGLSGPMGVAIDAQNDEIWATNYSDHSAVVFARTANGNVAPKRVVRNAPIGTPSVGFGNPGAVAYDSKRDEILVPN